MSVFVIISQQSPHPSLQTIIKEKYPNDHYELSLNQWLVSAKTTARGLSVELGITHKEDDKTTTGAAIVLSVSSYWGRANPNVWEWLKVNWGSVLL